MAREENSLSGSGMGGLACGGGWSKKSTMLPIGNGAERTAGLAPRPVVGGGLRMQGPPASWRNDFMDDGLMILELWPAALFVTCIFSIDFNEHWSSFHSSFHSSFESSINCRRNKLRIYFKNARGQHSTSPWQQQQNASSSAAATASWARGYANMQSDAAGTSSQSGNYLLSHPMATLCSQVSLLADPVNQNGTQSPRRQQLQAGHTK